MDTIKLKLKIPSAAENTAELEPSTVHPALPLVERAAEDAKQALERRRLELADRVRAVSAMPVRIQRGEVPTASLAEAIRERDAVALTIASLEAELVKARSRVDVEMKAATAAVEREVDRRINDLAAAVAQVAPVLTAIEERAQELLRVLHPGAQGFIRSIDWPCSGRCGAERATTSFSSEPAKPLLAWSSK